LSSIFVLTKSALADIRQYATGSNQLGCAKFLNKVEEELQGRRRTLWAYSQTL